MRQLVVLAEGAGGPDNVTVVVIDVRAAEAGLAPTEPGRPRPLPPATTHSDHHPEHGREHATSEHASMPVS